MWSAQARKKQKKDPADLPQWKLDQMREEGLLPPAAAPAAAAPVAAPAPAAGSSAGSSSSSSSSSAPPGAAVPSSGDSVLQAPDPDADAWGGAAGDGDGDDDDDDDDDDFDASKYDLGGGADEGADAGEDVCSVRVDGLAHQTTGDHLRAMFSDCGPVAQVLRAVDVRDRTAFVIFESKAAAAAAVGKSGATLHERELSVSLGMPDGAAAADAARERAAREREMADLGYAAGRLAGNSGVTRPMRGVVFSNDHTSGFSKHKQGREPGLPMPGAPPPFAPLPGGHVSTGGGWTTLANGARLPPGIDPKVGDWECPGCGNWNWARRQSCNKCGSQRRLA